MALTEFGKIVRKARLDAGVSLSSMAEELGVSAPFLSGLETVRKNVSSSWVRQIREYFLAKNVPKTSLAGLEEAADISNKSVPLEGLSLQQQMLVAGFARMSLDDEQLEKFKKLLHAANKDGD